MPPSFVIEHGDAQFVRDGGLLADGPGPGFVEHALAGPIQDPPLARCCPSSSGPHGLHRDMEIRSGREGINGSGSHVEHHTVAHILPGMLHTYHPDKAVHLLANTSDQMSRAFWTKGTVRSGHGVFWSPSLVEVMGLGRTATQVDLEYSTERQSGVQLVAKQFGHLLDVIIRLVGMHTQASFWEATGPDHQLVGHADIGYRHSRRSGPVRPGFQGELFKNTPVHEGRAEKGQVCPSIRHTRSVP